MHVVFVNQYFPPDTSATARLVRDEVAALLDAGHKVTVVCGRPSYQPDTRSTWRPWRRQSIGGADVLQLGSTAFDRARMPGRMTNYLSFLVLATCALAVHRGCDVVIVGSDPPFGVLAPALLRRSPLIYRLRDLHPDFSVASGAMSDGFAARLWNAIHVFAMRRADHIVCVGHAMRDRVVAKGIESARVQVLHDGANSPVGELDESVIATVRASSEFVAIHSGNLGFGIDWEAIAEAGSTTPTGVEVVFVGEGAEAEKVAASGVRVHPFVPSPKLASVMAAGDVQIVAQRRGVEMGAVASKMYSVMAHGRPVLVAATEESEPAIIAKEYECGVVCPPDDANAIATMLTWLRDHPEDRRRIGERAQSAFTEYFDRGKINRRFVELVEATRAHRTHNGRFATPRSEKR